MAEFYLKGKNQTIQTDFAGNQSLLEFYNFAKKFSNCWITLNFDGINFIDANLCALLFAMIYDLKKSNNVSTYIDFSTLKKDLNILIRNGFTYFVSGKQSTFIPIDYKDTTIPLKYFSQTDADNFCTYIEKEFLHQRGLTPLKQDYKEKINVHYLEIFSNVELHANTTYPIFTCGQYFPIQGELKFTLVDLGDGFLKKIKEFTKNTDKIITASSAIDWALRGNSTKKGACGGTGLIGIKKFCIATGNGMQIVTDNCYYSHFSKSINSQNILNPFKGTTIHLTFRYLNT